MADDRFGMANPYMVIRRGKGRGTARTTEKEKRWKQINDEMSRREKTAVKKKTRRREEEPE